MTIKYILKCGSHHKTLNFCVNINLLANYRFVLLLSFSQYHIHKMENAFHISVFAWFECREYKKFQDNCYQMKERCRHTQSTCWRRRCRRRQQRHRRLLNKRYYTGWSSSVSVNGKTWINKKTEAIDEGRRKRKLYP